MKNCNAPKHQTTRRILLIACATALAVAFTVPLPQPAHAAHVTPPEVPARLVPTGATAFLVGHAVGTQNYVCLPSGAGFAFVLFTPEATLFGDNGKQIIIAAGTVRRGVSRRPTGSPPWRPRPAGAGRRP